MPQLGILFAAILLIRTISLVPATSQRGNFSGAHFQIFIRQFGTVPFIILLISEIFIKRQVFSCISLITPYSSLRLCLGSHILFIQYSQKMRKSFRRKSDIAGKCKTGCISDFKFAPHFSLIAIAIWRAEVKMCRVILLAALSTVVSAGWAMAGTVNVTPSSMKGWSFSTFDSSYSLNPSAGTTGMVSGPATPPVGTGSAHLATPDGGDTAMIGTEALNGLKLSDITSLSYSTYMTSNNGSQFPYIQIAFNLNDGTGTIDNITFEPPYQTPTTGNPTLANEGPTAINTWQTWNAEDGGWWDGVSNNAGTGVKSLAYYAALYPDATITDLPVTTGSFLGLEFEVGDTSPGDGYTYDGNVDNVTIGIDKVNTTYNFDPDVAVPLPASAWSGLVLLGGLGLFGAVKQLRRRMA
ncbi:MAG TPA: hypothetical protein VGG19_06180 [Tepidisphaeraceae bacterium]|jgi:hypothetical protein